MKKILKYIGWIILTVAFGILYLKADSVAPAVTSFVDLLQRSGSPFLELLTLYLLTFLHIIEGFLFLIWPPAVAAAAIGAGWLISKKVSTGLLFCGMLLLIHAFGYWDSLIYTISLVIASVLVSLVVGIPSGMILAASRRLNAVMQPVLCTMQTLPPFIYLIPAVMFFSAGEAPGLIATILCALPPIIRLTSLAIRHVDPTMREAARAFGATRLQSVLKVELPQALPTILTGINQTAMIAVSMVITSSLVGSNGLGQEMLAAISQSDSGRGFVCGISIVFVAIFVNRISLDLVARVNEKRQGGV